MLTRKRYRQPCSAPAAAMMSPPSTGPAADDDRDREAEQAEGARPLGAGEELLDEAGALRGEQSGHRALQQPGRHHQPDAGREADRGAGDDEPHEADEHHPAPAVGVAQAPAGHEGQAEGEGVAGHDPLDGAR